MKLEAMTELGTAFAQRPRNELPQAEPAEDRLQIVITATFTATPLEQPLKFWMQALNIPADIHFSPYGQIIQEFLKPNSAVTGNRRGFNILLIRPEDWTRDLSSAGGIVAHMHHLRELCEEIIAAVKHIRTVTPASLLVFCCPHSAALDANDRLVLESIQNELIAGLNVITGVNCFSHDDLVRQYPVAAYEDVAADRLGHIPYTKEYFVALATGMARRMAAQLTAHYKVIVVDCDNTLWQGVCGEDGATGVELTPAHLRFQELLIDQQHAGMLLCLCSKNNASDVEAVFKNRSEMRLCEEHLAASRINWSPKSNNLESLAQELDLALDSFIYIDDNPVECAAVKSDCPSVLTLQFPQNPEDILEFLKHTWVFDRASVTEESKRRTTQYHQNRLRRRELEHAQSFGAFLASLDLKVDVVPLRTSDLERVAELTQRTNQFNLTTRRRSAGEIRALCGSGALHGVVVRVRDRFGNYGLVGAVLYHVRPPNLSLDTLVLSCRVLGRGVEHRIVNELGRIAKHERLSTIVMPYRRTPRNTPAFEFLESAFAEFRVEAGELSGLRPDMSFVIPTEYAESLDATVLHNVAPKQPRETEGNEGVSARSLAPQWLETTYRLRKVADITREIDRSRWLGRRATPDYLAPRNAAEESMARIWAETLGLERVGVHDRFIDVGGDSVLAVQALSRIEATLGAQLPLRDLLEGQTLEECARKLAAFQSETGEIAISANRRRAFPLSWAQQRLWFVAQLEGSSAAYHVYETLRLKGRLDCACLRSALDSLVARHEALRTTFRVVDGQPVQEASDESSVALRVIDVGNEGSQHDEDLRHHISQEIATPFDLERGPLLRVCLLRQSETDNTLVIVIHHLVSDAWSVTILVQELATLYGAYHQRRPNPLPPLHTQYADYAQWQHQRWTELNDQRQLLFWKVHLEGAAPLLELPTDRPRPERQSFRGGTIDASLGVELTADLRVFAQSQGLTLATVLCTAWLIVLSCVSGRDDIVIGIPVANRRRMELERLVGVFIDTLPLRFRVSEEIRVIDLLEHVRDTMLNGYENPDVPFEQIVAASQPIRGLSFSPVFQVMFVLHNTPSVTAEFPGLTLVEEAFPLETAQFDLLLSLQESGDRITGGLNYASDLFHAVTVERWIGYWKIALYGVVHESEALLGDLPWIDETQRHRVVQFFNSTAVAYPKVDTIHELFERQVERTPAAIAVVYEDYSLTYTELNRKANQLARHLRKLDIGPEQRVGIFAERSFELVVGVLGILKAGGAYVPLDPSYPAGRLIPMLDVAKPRVVLTQHHLNAHLPSTTASVILLDADWMDIGCNDASNLEARDLGLQSSNLAYVIYTSGSTGEPKGVMNEHRGVINRLQWMQDAYALKTDDRVLHKTPFSFDVSVWELFWTFMSGACLVIARPEGHKDPGYLRALIKKAGVTTVHFVPSMLQSFLDEYCCGECPSIQHIVCSGEELTAGLQNKCIESLPAIRLSNLYGPTEAAVDVTAWECHYDIERGPVPIGRPLSNIQLYVLDRRGRPLPVGVTGEIYIGGIGVGRGYLSRPDLTSERFVPDLFGPNPSGRLYRTGDRGRWRADGAIEYLGRTDGQVKIRGIRIELGEIQAQINRLASLKESLVLAREDTPGEKRLVAYVIPSADGSVDVDALRALLQAVLPGYMVPTAWVVMERFPVGPNGKVDRGNLPRPNDAAYYEHVEYEAPQGPLEEMLAKVWSDLLPVARIGRRSNFFNLGGHSLLMVKMAELLRREGISADLRSIYAGPTIRELARLLTRSANDPFSVSSPIPPQCEVISPQMLSLVELQPEQIERITEGVHGGASNIRDIYPLTPLQEGILFHSLMADQGGDMYVVPTLLALSSQRVLDELIAALQRVIDRHDVLRTAVLWERLPFPVQVVYRRAPLWVEEVKQDPERDPIDQLEEYMRPERLRLDLTRAPLLRMQVVRGGTEDPRRYALLQLHHLISDNVALQTLISEVIAHIRGLAEMLPQPIAYRSYVAQVLTHARTHDTEAFFRHKLGGITEPTAPFGLLDVLGDGGQIEEGHQAIEPALARRLRLQARRLGVSPATLFHAAWGLVVSHTCGSADVVYGTVLLGRLQSSTAAQQMLGMFINTLPLRLQLSNVTASELIEQTQQELVELFDYEQASLAVARRCSGISGSAPLFSTLLNYRHSAPDCKAEWEREAGIQVLAYRDRTNYPITVSVDDLDDGFMLSAQTQRPIEPLRMTGYLHTAVRSLADALEASSKKPALALPILTDSERHQIIKGFNSTESLYPPEKCLHQFFEAQAERAPDAVAVEFAGQTLTYARLNRKSNQLAHRLVKMGIGPDRLVGICAERSLSMVIGLMAILKAGGAYVPLDPEHPTQRLRDLLEDTAPRVVLIQARLKSRLPETNSKLVALDDHGSEIDTENWGNLDAQALGLELDHLAYVIYTSGSTGQPKGAMNSHRGVVNRLQWMQAQYGLSVNDRVLQKTPYGFDVSVWEFFWPLMSGARLIVARPEGHKDPTYLRKLIEETGVTTVHFVPSMLKSFLDQHQSGQCPSLLHIVSSGEALSAELQQKCFRCLPQVRLSNLYGPTETAVDVMAWECSREDANPCVPIGRPISNTQIYLLDRYLQPVPVGVAGEIYIGGVGVGRGYLNRPALTAERFIADPFSTAPWARLYKTGDLGRWRSQGAIEYLGRNDHQVKVRGFRIELGEIETRLKQHDPVKEAVVIARDDVPDEKRLVAYLTRRAPFDPERRLDLTQLYAHLESVLPAYMIPGAFVVLESLPLTPSGKLDRRSLPPPEGGSYVTRQHESPQDVVEETLGAIWEELLHVERIGRHDNFFELGGHSLMIVQMRERLRIAGLISDVRCIYESPTLADLASTLAQKGLAQFTVPPNLIPPGCIEITPTMLPLVELEPGQIAQIASSVPEGTQNIQDIYPLAPLQEGILFHSLLNREGGDPYVLPTLLEIPSHSHLEGLIAALQRVIDRHDVLRAAVLWEHLPRPVQVVYRRAALPVEELQLNPALDPIDQLRTHMRPDRQRLKLAEAPLLRVQIAMDREGGRCYVLLQLHHLVCDAESLRIVIAEVMSFLEGTAENLPEPVSYRCHVAQALAHARAHDAEAFFRGKLSDIDEPTAPFGLLDVHGDGSRIEEARRPLGQSLSDRLRVQARHLGVSAATVFHAAWALVVATTSAREEVVYGSVLLGRLQGSAGAQRILGMFINTLPLRLNLQGITVKELIEQTQRELIELLMHEQASLAVAQRCSGVSGSTPLFSTLLNFRHGSRNVVVEENHKSGIRVLVDQGRTNYPITLSIDDLGNDFLLTAQTDQRIDPQQIIEYLATAMASLVDALETAPTMPALCLVVLPERELRQMAFGFNETSSDACHRCLHEEFLNQAVANPHRVALEFQDGEMTYEELLARSQALSRQLLQEGTQVNDIVAVVTHKGWKQIVAVLGVLIAGAAYLPIDPHWPPQRCRDLLEASAATVAVIDVDGLTDEMDRWPERVVRVIVRDERPAEVAAAAPPLRQSSADLAYVIFTSGSTGAPKGVMIDHRSAMNTLWHLNRQFDVGMHDKALLVSELSFDLSVFDIFALLSVGGAVVIPNARSARDPGHWLDMIQHHRVSIWNSVPQLMVMAVQQQELGYVEALSHLRLVLLSGDWIPVQLPARLRAVSKSIRVVSLGGATEGSVWSIFYPVDDIDPAWASIPYGKPLPNQKMYVLDSVHQCRPVGVTGEIYIAGDGVALGYLNRPDLTAERFLPDPFSADPHARMYKTGDLGRWRSDGIMEYLGRNDHQVKIRGFRIELGEIESHLIQHELVREAVVIAREYMPGDRRLVAYIVASNAQPAHESEIEAQSEVELVQQWKSIYDLSYGEQGRPSFIGWNSSYTGEPMAEEAMREWLDSTVTRIRQLHPRRVLELGCGLGLVLAELAHECDAYHGTDFSTAAIDNLTRWLTTQDRLNHVTVSRRAATDLPGAEIGAVDTLILNSVVQYFPNLAYLLRVLRHALERVCAGGRIFIGDVRNLNLLELFHSSVQLAKATPEMSILSVRRRIRRNLEQEKELVVAPEFFKSLPEHFPTIGKVDIQLKRGTLNNELTAFRYDVVLHVGEVHQGGEDPTIDLDYEGGHSVEALESVLRKRSASVCRLRRISNRRLASELHAAGILAGSDDRQRIGELRGLLEQKVPVGEDPEYFWTLGERYGYAVRTSWSPGSLEGEFDVDFIDCRAGSQAQRGSIPRTETVRKPTPLQEYVNDPLAVRSREIASTLRESLKRDLPDYMIPSAIVVVKSLPLTANGKVDRAALPSPESDTSFSHQYEAPQGDTEIALAQIWQDLLRLDQVGRQDNFFELGGHSLTAMRLIVRIAESFKAMVPVTAIFQYPTLHEMAVLIEVAAELSLA